MSSTKSATRCGDYFFACGSTKMVFRMERSDVVKMGAAGLGGGGGGLKSAGEYCLDFFGSRCALASNASSADVWDQFSLLRDSDIQSSSRSENRPGLTPTMPANFQTSCQHSRALIPAPRPRSR